MYMPYIVSIAQHHKEMRMELRDSVTELCNVVMRGVVESGTISADDTRACDIAVDVMREEVKAFFTADRYADEREAAVAMGTRAPLLILTCNCVTRIKDAIAHENKVNREVGDLMRDALR